MFSAIYWSFLSPKNLLVWFTSLILERTLVFDCLYQEGTIHLWILGLTAIVWLSNKSITMTYYILRQLCLSQPSKQVTTLLGIIP